MVKLATQASIQHPSSLESPSPSTAPCQTDEPHRAGIKAADADNVIDELVAQMKDAVGKIALPPLPDYGPKGKETAVEMLKIIRARLNDFAYQ
jgi:hypothetical protein